VRDAIDEVLEPADPDDDASVRGAWLGRLFARLAAPAREAYQAAKRARGGLDFDDLLLRARDLLRDDPDVREAEAQAVTFVLVDEFQDTDPVQSEILRLLCGDGFAAGRLFVVGDFKQSIYRFRGARPRLFQDYRAAFPEAGRLDLTENFRSVPGVIDFVNALFHGAFEGESGRLLPGGGAAGAAESDPPAVLFVWPEDTPPARDEGEAAPPRKPTKPSTEALREAEARWLARLVRSRLDAGWAVRDRATRTTRPARPGDVAMLFRSMTDLASYEQALTAEGLDYHVIGGASFYAQDEVRDLINVLSAVEDPFDGIALAGALRSPFFGLTDDALFWLGVADRGDLAARFLADEARAALSATDRQRCDRARRLLDRWRGLKDRVPMGDLVDRVLDESGYEAALLGEPLGGRKRANARKLARIAREFDARGGFTLAQFVARLRADLRDPPKEEQAATADEDGKAVRLMSIHQSKGLEFPIVVVPDLNRSGPSRHGLVAFDPDLGPLARPGGDDPDAEAGSGGPQKSLGRRRARAQAGLARTQAARPRVRPRDRRLHARPPRRLGGAARRGGRLLPAVERDGGGAAPGRPACRRACDLGGTRRAGPPA
ncbi:MAG: UvrD-helicase domain-containing protein, partial [Thermoleophilia bacterium]|nr:UvrD-helicase domain-containing protein [Thermoleophilia bacterium]